MHLKDLVHTPLDDFPKFITHDVRIEVVE